MIEKYFPNQVSISLIFKTVTVTCVAFFMLLAFKSWVDIYANDELSNKFEFGNIYLDDIISTDSVNFGEIPVGETKSATVDVNSISYFSAIFTVQFAATENSAFYFDLADFDSINIPGVVTLVGFDGELSRASLATVEVSASSTAVLRFNFAPFEGRQFNTILRLTDELGATREISIAGTGLGAKWEFVNINDLVTIVTSLNLTEDAPQAIGTGTTIGLALKNSGNREANPQFNYDFFDVAVGEIAGPFDIVRRVDADGSLSCDEIIFPGELCYMSFNFAPTEENMLGEIYKTFTAVFNFVSSDGNGLSLDLSGIGEIDTDLDIKTDSVDNCPYNYNLDQADIDQDGVGDACDDDADNDGVVDENDVCNGQDDTIDLDQDTVPDCIDPLIDSDQDGIDDNLDACDNTPFGEISDINAEGCGLSERDSDADGVNDNLDQCEGYNDAIDSDEDKVPDACDDLIDRDFDNIGDADDNCPDTANALQEDTNEDWTGDACQSVWEFEINDVAETDVANFGQVVINQSATLDINVVNIGGKSATVQTAILEELGFSIIASNCERLSVAPTESCEISIQYTAIDVGTDLATFMVLGSDDGSASLILQATGITSEQDSDQDGITDNLDACDNTASGEISEIDAEGCGPSERDSDGDEVVDSLDKCPGYNDATDIDVDGIPDGCDSDVNTGGNDPDTDGDGIADNVDLCQNTAIGAPVNTDGCSASQLDSDLDGVLNTVDLCANTPIGAIVNTSGCSTSQLDSDKDGVTDNVDQCPNQGGVVDSHGCPTTTKIKGGSGANYNLLDDLTNVPSVNDSKNESEVIDTTDNTNIADDDLGVNDENDTKVKVRRTLYNSGRLVFDSNRNLRFTDISNNIYAKYIDVLKGYKNNLGQYAISGEGNTVNGVKYAQFEPDMFVTRLAAMKIALVMNGYNIENRVRRDGRVFYDIPSEKSVDQPPIAWIRSVVHSAYSAGIINGDDGSSDYDKYATRAEVLNIFANAAKVFDGKEYDVDKFDDVDGWVADLIGFLEDATSIDGRTDDVFMPYAFAKRSEAVKFAIDIAKITNSFMKAPEVYEPVEDL